MKRQLKRTTLSIAVAQAALIYGGAAFAQTADSADKEVQTIVVTGQRAAMQSAAKLKQNAEDIVDGVVAEEAGKLPEKSITEVLQRVVGVSIDRNRSRGDPEHFSVEGSGVSIRGLTWGSSTLNGRESFSAGWPGRELSWGDVPPELMSAVLIHKNPPADLVEGGVSGQVDLRTALPFDYKSEKIALSAYANYTELGAKTSPAVSGLYSKRWNTSAGEFGALIDLSYNKSNTRNDTVQLDAYFPRTEDGQTLWVPKSASWRTNTGEMERAGIYGALQWKKDNLASSLTYFHSGYKENSEERALYTDVENPYTTTVTNPVYDDRGVLQSGRLSYPFGGVGANHFAAGGLGFASATGFNESTSHTGELAWNTKWTLNDRWSFQSDLQWVHSANKGFGNSMQLATFVPSMNIDITGTPAKVTFDDAALEHLANRDNFFMHVMGPAKKKAEADLYTWKGDVKFKFDDPVMRDVRFGVRLTERKTSHQRDGGSGWWSLSQPWSVAPTRGQPGTPPETQAPGDWRGRADHGYFSDPTYGNLVPTEIYDFANFFSGKIGTPAALVMPTMAFARDPASPATLIPITKELCLAGAEHFGYTPNCENEGANWLPPEFNDNPARTFRQAEKTQAVYLSTRFGFDDWHFPVEGSAGVRVIHTKTTAHGYTILGSNVASDSNGPPDLPLFNAINEPIDKAHSYVNVLPSMNLRMELTSKLQARFAFAKAMYRPGFNDLAEQVELQQNVIRQGDNVTGISYQGRAEGNVYLKPIKSDNYDLTLEWYPGSGSSLTLGLFHKDVKDIILRTAYVRAYNSAAGNPQNFLISAPNNVADGSVSGMEIAGQTYLDHIPALQKVLPDWVKGFGISANYTYIDSKQRLYNPFKLDYCPSNGSFNNSSLSIYGCDTNGLPFDQLPIQYLSKNAANLVFLYDRGPLSARLAYSWRSRFLQGVSTNGTNGNNGTSADPARAVPGDDGQPVYPQDVGWGLPTWQEATGQLDMGIDYRFTDRISGTFAASNLTDAVVKQTQQQHIGVMPRAWFQPGRSYRLALRYTY